MEGAREYAAGDPMNRIHWKATAHIGTLQVYRQGYTADPEVVIFLNVEMEKDSWRELEEAEQMEHAISAAATCVSALIGQGVAVGFGHNAYSSYERQLQPGRGSAHLQDLYQCMAGIRLRTQAPLKTYLQDQNGAHPSRDYIIISVENSPAVKDAIQELEGAGRSVSLIQTGEAPEHKFKEVSGQ
ncbi:DUF58 domain-containing protein [Paenibacillus sp. CAA11]|uniref:DUF58 domain-containing protein n=1 Tax=Paenibacillus sp. CAA11 TaxID=1532905 RepID=UPI002D78A1EA|nr:DUF58 domain-containing protein [Paenibacillus sp. CAA11]